MSSRSVESPTPQFSETSCILVLGMHRSGTSAFTRVFSLLGCDLPGTPMAADKSNESGYWESEAIRQLNDRILASAGTSWDDWLEVNPGWLISPKAAEFREEALRLVRQEFGSSRLFVLKDPRICRLVPFWLAVLEEAGAQTLIVSPVRNPLEVAVSLGSRNGFETGLGHLLWLRHVLDAEFASRGTPRFFTSYDCLMGGWARTAKDAQRALGIAWPRMSDKAAREIEGFLSDRHRHYQESLEAVLENPTLSDWVRSTFAILSNWITAGENPQDFPLLDGIRTALNTAAPCFSHLLSGEQEKASRLEKELGSERQRVGVAEQQISRLNAELESRTRAAEEAERSLGEVRHRLAQTESALAQRSHEAEQTAGELAPTREDLRQMAAARAEVEIGTVRLTQHIALLMADVQERQAALAAEREDRAMEMAETDKAIAAVAKQVRQVLAVLDTSRQEMTSRFFEAEQARARQSAEFEIRLQQHVEEIEALERQVKEKQAEAHYERAQAEQTRRLAAGEIGRAVGRLLNGHRSLSHRLPFRRWRQVALLRRSGLLDADWYLREYTDVAQAGMEPLRHYVEFGAKEGRAPNAALAHANGKAEVRVEMVPGPGAPRESEPGEPAVADAPNVLRKRQLYGLE